MEGDGGFLSFFFFLSSRVGKKVRREHEEAFTNVYMI